jgi:DNA-binding transcriptional ArsR family regulator
MPTKSDPTLTSPAPFAVEHLDPKVLRTNAGRAAALLKSMANRARLLILCQLVVGEKSVGALEEQLDLSQSALSQHLAVLRKQQLVQTRREAQSVFYSLKGDDAVAVMGALYGLYCMPAAMGRGKPAAEGTASAKAQGRKAGARKPKATGTKAAGRKAAPARKVKV